MQLGQMVDTCVQYAHLHYTRLRCLDTIYDMHCKFVIVNKLVKDVGCNQNLIHFECADRSFVLV